MSQCAFCLTRLAGLSQRRKPLIRTPGNWDKIQTRELVNADQSTSTKRDSRSRTNVTGQTLVSALYSLS